MVIGEPVSIIAVMRTPFICTLAVGVSPNTVQFHAVSPTPLSLLGPPRCPAMPVAQPHYGPNPALVLLGEPQ